LIQSSDFITFHDTGCLLGAHAVAESNAGACVTAQTFTAAAAAVAAQGDLYRLGAKWSIDMTDATCA
jgi:hypothetical protein